MNSTEWSHNRSTTRTSKDWESWLLNNVDIPPLCFQQVKERCRLRNCLRNAKSSDTIIVPKRSNRMIGLLLLLQLPDSLLLPLPDHPQVDPVLLPQPQDLPHPLDETILPGMGWS